MTRKHTIIRAAKPFRLDGIDLAAGDIVAHLVSDAAPASLGSLLCRNRGMLALEEIDPDESEIEVDDPEDSQTDDSLRKDADSPAGNENASSDEDDPPNSETGSTDGENKDPKPSAFAGLELSDQTVNALEKASRGEFDEKDDEIPDFALLATPEGVKEWKAKHDELTTIPGIGKTRSDELIDVLKLQGS